MREKVLSLNFRTEPGYLYYIDPEGDISRIQIEQWLRLPVKSDGTHQKPFLLDSQTYEEGIKAEYVLLSEKYGVRDKDWELLGQQLIVENGRSYDKLNIRIFEGNIIDTVFFDITEPLSKLLLYLRIANTPS